MYKNQLQELAQRSCFNLPSYTSIREGPDHAPRFKAVVNFNGECFESPTFCSTLRLAEHAAAEVALDVLSNRGPRNSLAARVLDETGIYKNLLQEVSQRVGASLPSYTTSRSSSGYVHFFTCTVELAGISFTGEPAKGKKQAEKSAAMTAWVSLKQLAQEATGSSTTVNNDEQEHVIVARALQGYLQKEKPSSSSHPVKFPVSHSRTSNSQPPPITSSRILPLSYPKTRRPALVTAHKLNVPLRSPAPGSSHYRPHKFPAPEAVPYIPIRHLRPYQGIAPPVTIRTIIPAYSSPIHHLPPANLSPPVHVRQTVPVSAPTPVGSNASDLTAPTLPNSSPLPHQDPRRLSQGEQESELASGLKELKI